VKTVALPHSLVAHGILLLLLVTHYSNMKLSSIALAFLTIGSATANPFAATSKNDAKAKYVAKLMRGAKETANSQLHRGLDQNQEEYVVDISAYAVKFEQCQFVKTYSDELAEQEDYDTVLETQRFVIFRLCPMENAYGGTQTCSSCSYNFGEYLIDLDTYLESTVGYYQEEQEAMCQACEEACQNDDQQNQDGDDGGRRNLQDCSSCVDECYKIENMEAAGYIDATEFLECQMIYDPEDDGAEGLYAGPMCASSGTKIKIGVFKDEMCSIHDDSKEVDEYIVDGDGVQMKLSHALLKNTYATDQCISCIVVEENNGRKLEQTRQLDQNANQILDICENLYQDAAKCEKTHGFDNGYSNYYGYENQLAQEEIVCDYMSSLMAGTYGEDGEIIVNGANIMSGGASSTTGGQKFALAFFIIGTVGLAAYAAVLHSKLTKGGKAELSRQGGAMA